MSHPRLDQFLRTAWLLSIAIGTCTAGDFYVSPKGNDANPGSLALPWRTVQKAADTLAAGDTAWIRRGTYHELVTARVSGSATAGWITFRAYPKEVPVIDGTRLAPAEDSESALFLIKNQNYIRLQGLELRNLSTRRSDLDPCGIFVLGACDHVELLGNNVHHISTLATDGNALGVAVYGTSAASPIQALTIDGNQVHHCRLGSSESMVLNGNVTGFQVSNNRVYNNNNIGVDFAGFEGTCPDPSLDQARDGVCRGNLVYNIMSYGNPAYGHVFSAGGIYADGGTRIVIERNVVHHCDIGIELASEHAGRTTSAVTAHENVVYLNRIGGFFLGGYDELRGGTTQCFIHHNTLFQNDTRHDGNGEIYFQHFVTNCSVLDNIASAGAQNLFLGSPYADSSGNIFNYNLWYSRSGSVNGEWQWLGQSYTGFAAFKAAIAQDAASRFGDPRFAAPARANFHLMAGSPAIDGGDPAFVAEPGELDLDGAARINGGTVDIGADEF